MLLFVLVGAILGEVILHSPAEHPQGAVIDSDEDSSGDSFSDDTEGEEDLDEDRCNSAGEEMEEEEFDESQVGACVVLSEGDNSCRMAVALWLARAQRGTHELTLLPPIAARTRHGLSKSQ